MKRPLLAAIALLAATFAHGGESLTIATEEYPPYNMTGDKGGVTGVSTDIVRQLLDRAGVDYKIEIYPWQRAVSMAKQLPNTCVYSMSKTPERTPDYTWIGPLVDNDWVLFVSEKKAAPASLEAAANARFGSYTGDAIVRYLQDRNYQVDIALTDDLNPRKLLAGRIDYWATGKLIGQYILQQNKISGIRPTLTFNRTQMYLACHRRLPFELVQQLNQLLLQMGKDGSINRIYEKYGYSR